MSLTVMSELFIASQRIGRLEQLLSKGLYQPFNNMNSASRKIMQETQLEHIIALVSSDVPMIQTGYEDEFGRYNSSLYIADEDLEVVGKACKYSIMPNHNYILLLRNKRTGEHSIIDRTFAVHSTETFGYLMNNKYIDKLNLGDTIPTKQTIKSSNAYSDFGNRMDGVNVVTAYMTDFYTTEDNILVSETAAKTKFVSPLVHDITVMLNSNDIPLNLMGDQIYHKSFPNIGEQIKDGILCALRREIKEESLFSLSHNRLKDITISDEKFLCNGIVLDVDIACNNPEGLDSFYNSQIREYYKDSIRFAGDIVAMLRPIIENGLKCTYELKKMYMKYNDILQGKKWINKNPFSNTILTFKVLEYLPLSDGDKIADRFGSKGVVKIVPDEMMPMNAYGERVEVIINAIGPVGRENPGQLIELSTNFISDEILKAGWNLHHTDDFIELYLEYVSIVNPRQYEYVRGVLSKLDDREKYMFIDSTLEQGLILSLDPISESIDIDKLSILYDKFKFIRPSVIKAPIVDSNGNVRMVDTRRPITVGKKYMYRLKQYSEDKSSAVSLGSTNIKNEPVKPKTNKIYKAPYSKTPIKFGEMESGNMFHFLNIFPVVSNLMLHSSSPTARRSASSLLTGDPFNIDLQLPEDSINRGVEELNTYLKAIGLRIVFTKRKKKVVVPFTFTPFTAIHEEYDEPYVPFTADANPVKPFNEEYPVMFTYSPFDKI